MIWTFQPCPCLTFSSNLQNIIIPKPIGQETWNFERMFTPHMCHVSCVSWHVSHVTCHLSHTNIYLLKLYIYILHTCCTGCKRRPNTNATPPIGKIHPFSKIAITFEPVMQFRCPSRFGIKTIVKLSILWLKAPSSTISAWRRHTDIFTNHNLLNYSINQ